MKKIITTIISLLLLNSCVNEIDRMNYLRIKFPNNKIEPATGLIKQGGYEFIMIDSANQIIAVSFYPFSKNKINSFKNVR